jgi:predicted nuclease with TOPRIM domain
MAQDPKITLNVDTSAAVKNLMGLEGQAIDTDGSIDKIDGSTISVDTTATQKALQNVADQLDKVDDKGTKAGKGGIPVTTTAFKDLTEGIGGPATGAIGSAFAFGESIEGLGDLVEGFGGRLGLSETQIGKVTSSLGTALGVLGAVGVAFTVGKIAYDAFTKGAKQAAKEQEKFNDAVDSAEKSLNNVADLLKAGQSEKAFKEIVSDLEPLLQDLAESGFDAADAVLEIAGAGDKFTRASRKKVDALEAEIAALDARAKELASQSGFDAEQLKALLDGSQALRDQKSELEDLIEQIKIRSLGVQGATEIDELAAEALARFNTTTEETIELQREAVEGTLDAIDAQRGFERSLDDTQQALEDYNQAVKDAKGDTEKIDDAARDAADTVIDLAQDFGGLEGAARGTEEWQTRTTNALGYVAGTLAPDDPLRKRLLDYKAELDSIPAIKTTAITSTIQQVPLAPGGQAVATRGQQLYGAPGSTNMTVNMTVTSADPNSIVRALQTYVRQNGSLPANIR